MQREVTSGSGGLLLLHRSRGVKSNSWGQSFCLVNIKCIKWQLMQNRATYPSCPGDLSHVFLFPPFPVPPVFGILHFPQRQELLGTVWSRAVEAALGHPEASNLPREGEHCFWSSHGEQCNGSKPSWGVSSEMLGWGGRG